MKRIALVSFTVFTIFFALNRQADTQAISQNNKSARSVTEPELREASAKAIKLVQQSQATWSKKETCASCHHQLLPEVMFKMARERGVPFDETIARDTTAATFSFLKDLDMAVQRYDFIDIFFDGWLLVAANSANLKPNLSTAAYSQFIASRQLADGSWFTTDVRPPQAYSRFTTTAICARAVRDYLPESLKAEKESRLQRARTWLFKTEPQNTEDKTFRLLGLLWTSADENSRKLAALQLLKEQREDGGWAQLNGLASDAYSTGQVLAALREGVGLSTSDPAYQRGLSFLLKTQQADGSWRVESRLHPPAPVSPPYFETGFPYQHDQFISAMGTTWATTALLHALPVSAEAKAKSSMPVDIAPAEQAAWVQVALNGSAADLKKLLNTGIKPDAKTAEGTTALMLAARDLEKVKLLVARGADVNARATTGITALMVAARFKGNAEVVRFLLKQGAKPNSEPGIEVTNEASALFFAVLSGDTQSVEALIAAGASLKKMKILGRFLISPLFAALFGDAKMVECLINKGANANEADDDGISALGWTTISNHPDVMQVLLAHGSDVNHVDKFGMTPLLYAASINYGDTEVLEKLIAAGADLKAKNKEGLTAYDLASQYHHTTMMNLLAGKSASR
jgi:ankyrin repeat protein